jgi:hypothetical protein
MLRPCQGLETGVILVVGYLTLSLFVSLPVLPECRPENHRRFRHDYGNSQSDILIIHFRRWTARLSKLWSISSSDHGISAGAGLDTHELD